MPEVTKEVLLAARKKLEKYKIPKTKDGYYIVDLHKWDKATIKLIKESGLFTRKEES